MALNTFTGSQNGETSSKKMPTPGQSLRPSPSVSNLQREMVRAGDLFSPKTQGLWQQAVYSHNGAYVPWFVDSVQWPDDIWQPHWQLRFPSVNYSNMEFWNCVLFDIPTHIWKLSNTIRQDEELESFRQRIQYVWGKTPSATRTKLEQRFQRVQAVQIETSDTQINEEKFSNLPPALHTDDESDARESRTPASNSSLNDVTTDNAEEQSSGRRPSSKGPTTRYRCPVRDCKHKKSGYTRKGFCENHVRKYHESFLDENSDWESLIVPVNTSSDVGSMASHQPTRKRSRKNADKPPALDAAAIAPMNDAAATSNVGSGFRAPSPAASDSNTGFSPSLGPPPPSHSRSLQPSYQMPEQQPPYIPSTPNNFYVNSTAFTPSTYGFSNNIQSQQYSPTFAMTFTPPSPTPVIRQPIYSGQATVPFDPNAQPWSTWNHRQPGP